MKPGKSHHKRTSTPQCNSNRTYPTHMASKQCTVETYISDTSPPWWMVAIGAESWWSWSSFISNWFRWWDTFPFSHLRSNSTMQVILKHLSRLKMHLHHIPMLARISLGTLGLFCYVCFLLAAVPAPLSHVPQSGRKDDKLRRWCFDSPVGWWGICVWDCYSCSKSAEI